MIQYIKIFFIIPAALFLLTGRLASGEPDQKAIYEKYSSIADRIVETALNDTGSYERLAYFCDTFGHRFSGSDNLNNALQWAYSQMLADGLANVKLEEVMVPHWVRGEESCELVLPRSEKLHIVGLGNSVGTQPEGITAYILVVSSFQELDKRAAEARNKIVVFDVPFTNYGQTVQYRTHGAERAAQYGALASLIRSVSPVGMQLCHTGWMEYADTIPKIPQAALSAEDAMMLHRMHDRGQKPVVKITMGAKLLPDALSYNLMGELQGSKFPNEIIALGGHSDSWDQGTGAHDDGAGCMAGWEAVNLLKKLNIKPKRTLRSVFWVNEENGLRGGRAYEKAHKNEKHVLAFEFDSGVFPPSQIGYNGPDSLLQIVKAFEPLLQKIDSIKVNEGGGGVDISPMTRNGIPAMSLNTNDQGKYFWYHHSAADTVDKIDPVDYKKCIAAIALAIFLYSELF